MKPFIVDRGPLRHLHFDRTNVQSVMRLDEPDELCFGYTRRMMTFLLFNGAPRRILLLGLGGGSLAKFCYRRLPQAAITAVEIEQDVLALRDQFRIPADDERFRVVHADAAAHIARPAAAERRNDVILVDACDQDGIAPTLGAPDFYRNVRRRLTLGGVMVMNLCGELPNIECHCARVRGVFGDAILSLPARDDGNLIVLAFRRLPPLEEGAALDSHARRLQEQFGLAFPRYVRTLKRNIAVI